MLAHCYYDVLLCTLSLDATEMDALIHSAAQNFFSSNFNEKKTLKIVALHLYISLILLMNVCPQPHQSILCIRVGFLF